MRNTTYAITNEGQVYMFEKGKPLQHIPKSWHKSELIVFEAFSSQYSSGVVTIYGVYGNDNITFRYSRYVDGSFHPICGRCHIVNSMPDDTYIPKKVKDNIWIIDHINRFKR